jgi:hypothetical protein
MKYFIASILVIFSFVAIPAQAGRLEPIQNFENQQIKRFDNKKLTMEDVQMAIRNAAEKVGWRVEPNGPGKIIATLVVRNRHTAVVDITYSPESYSITYKDSKNLDYTPTGDEGHPVVKDGTASMSTAPLIHANYNKWVQHFNDAIYRELQR